MSEHDENFDVVIMGGGPAGLSAAIYSSWLGLRTVVLETGVSGGRALQASRIENFPGFDEGISGNDLVAKMSRQAMSLGASVKTSEEVIGLEVGGEIKKVTSRRKSYRASAVIVCTGTQGRKLRVSGEAEFLGRGVSYCAVCDGPFFKNVAVAVVGGGQEALVDALFLADLAKAVTLVTHEKDSEIEGNLEERLRNKLNVEIVKGQLVAILGDQVVKSIKILEPDAQRVIEKEVRAVFISLGGVPMTEIVKKAGISTDKNGCLIVDRLQRTNLEGVFAAGDCTCGGMQVVTAAGEGAMAAMKASAYIRRSRAQK
jgi:thioredoxin reductase (NADPH)